MAENPQRRTPKGAGQGWPDSSGCAQHLSRASAWSVLDTASPTLAWPREAGPRVPGHRRPTILEEMRARLILEGRGWAAAQEMNGWQGLACGTLSSRQRCATPPPWAVRVQCLPNTEQPILLKGVPALPRLPSLASYHLKCHTSSPTALHSALYLRMGTPPVASGSSNCTCAVLEYGSTWSMDGEDGVSAGRAQMETVVSPTRSGTALSATRRVSHFLGFLSPRSCRPAHLTI